jgi:hypothetical protein
LRIREQEVNKNEWEKNMKNASMLSIALIAGLSVAAWTSQGLAAGRDTAAVRDAAMSRCLAEARRHYPGKYYDWGETRDHSYQACMFDAGFPP